MNILFMSLSNYQTLGFHSLYSDLLRQFIMHGDKVYVISPFERNADEEERVIYENGAMIMKVKIWKMQKTNVFEKVISMLTIDKIFVKAIKKYFSKVHFDLILYPTPPITLLGAVEYVKKRDGAKTFLLLKDIFPQNAIDIGLMKAEGFKGFIYKYFRMQERKLYEISDHIGCMSKANVTYLLAHNPQLDSKKVIICPNTIDPIDMSCLGEERELLRKKYNIPLHKKVFVYGGNLGKPQDIPFIIECLKQCQNNESVFFLIAGNGTEYGKIKKYIDESSPKNVKLMKALPKDDYDKMIGSCDVGLIFLDYRFSIPNFPSRLLSYMQAKLPVLACTDVNSDIGETIVKGRFGWWCRSDSVQDFENVVKSISTSSDLQELGENAYHFLRENYSSEKAYTIICRNLY